VVGFFFFPLFLVPVPDGRFSLAFRDTGFLLGNGVSLHNLLHLAPFLSRDTGYFV
jgi:hypothetical protein